MSTFATTFAVTGTLRFPIDMLRYEGCYPVSEHEDSATIVHSLMREGEPVPKPYRVAVRKVHNLGKHWRPTAGRWESFGWRVEERSVETTRLP